MLTPADCPRFQRCNASVCPLAEHWAESQHLRGEAVCQYLLNSGKVGAHDRFVDDPVFATCIERLPAITKQHGDIRRRVERASRSGFRDSNLPKEHQRRVKGGDVRDIVPVPRHIARLGKHLP